MYYSLKQAILTLGMVAVCFTLPAQRVTNLPTSTDTVWQKIVLLSHQEASVEIRKLYETALSEKAYGRVVKAITYRMNIQRDTKGDFTRPLLDSLMVEAERLPQPAKAVVYTLIADVYRAYYKTNQRQIMQRTRAEEVDDDFETWDISRLFEQSLKYYKMSIQDEKILQQTPVDDYSESLFYFYEKETQRLTLPTLYDLLTYRAIQAFGSELAVVLPQQAFVINQPACFADARAFTQFTLTEKDTLSAEYQSLLLFQKLLRFRLQQPDDAENRFALVLIDMERLRYVHAKGRYPNNDAMYEKALQAMIDGNQAYPEKHYPMYALAKLKQKMALDWGKSKNEAYRGKFKEAYHLCEQITTASSDTMLVSRAQGLQDEIKNPSLTLKMNYLQYPETSMLAHVSYRNIQTIYLYFYRLNDEEAARYYRSWNYNDSSTDFSIEPSSLVKKQTVNLLSQPDYQDYTTEIKLDGLPQGCYVVLTSDIPDLAKENVKKHQGSLTTGIPFQVSSLGVAVSFGGKHYNFERQEMQTLVNVDDQMMMQIYMTDGKTGEPLKNGTINYYCGWDYMSSNLLRTYTTDDLGMVYFTRECDTRALSKFVATHKNGRFVFYGDFSNIVSFGRAMNNPAKPQPKLEAVFFTDRAVYRPGQTISFKSLCFENQQLLPDYPLTIEFWDVNRKIIASQELTTNDFGTVQSSFVIPQGILNGVMSLVCKMDDQTVQQNIRVEEYKRPTFEAVFDPIDGNYRLNDSARVSGKALSLAGYVVDNARVAYRVVRSEQSRYSFQRQPLMRVSQQREIMSGTTKTHSDGTFEVAFKAEADDVRDETLIYLYTVIVDITDANGETRNAMQTMKISAQPLLVKTNVPQRIINRDALSFDLSTTNLNGDFTPAEVVVTLSELKSPTRIFRERLWEMPDTLLISRPEFEKAFPNDVYGEDNLPESFPVFRQLSVIQLNTANDTTIHLSELKKAKAGWYRLDIKARTPNDVLTEEQINVQLSGALNEKNASITTMNEWLTLGRSIKQNELTRPDRSYYRYEPGENIEFLVAGGNEKSYLYYEIILKDKVIEQKTITTGTTPQRLVIPVKETYCGGVSVQFVMMQNQRLYHHIAYITVPYTNKLLDVTFTSFRDKLLPGAHEKWTLSVKNKQGEKEQAEMVATLYDASLDAVFRHSWASIDRFYPQPSFNVASWQIPFMPSPRTSTYLYRDRKIAEVFKPVFPLPPVYPSFTPYYTVMVNESSAIDEATIIAFGRARREGAVQLIPPSELQVPRGNISGALGGRISEQSISQEDDIAAQDGIVATRRNFNETAFFFPQLRTDENGEITFEFTIPEALTRWNMFGFAHTKDFKVGNIISEVVTQKQVAISANAPRFFRENDVIEFSAKVNNITDEGITGQAVLHLYDATNMQPVDAQIIRSSQSQEFNVKTGESAGLKWTLTIPEDIPALTYKVTAQAGKHTDGEEKTVPVLANALLVTETMPFSARGGKSKTFTFSPLKDNASSTLRHHRLTLEFTSNPAWYAIQAMPYMMEYPYECAEQVFTRFFANSLATTVTNSSPRIKEIFDLWQTLPEHKDVLMSNLEKNQELKQALLEESPWVMQADNETERHKRVGLLFDLNRMGNEQQRAFDKFRKMQLSGGGFPWFDGLPPSRFITQHILAGIGHLQALNALDAAYTAQATQIVNRGFVFLDHNIWNDYEDLRKMNNFNSGKQHITSTELHYLYTCSFTKHQPESKEQYDAFDFYYNQASLYWKNFNLYGQALIALTMHRYGNTKTASAIIHSLKERAQRSEDMGMFWKDNVAGRFWDQAPIETQAMLIEAFNEVADDTESVEDMKIWLLRHKQTNDWKTTKATAEACYALLMTGDRLLDESQILEVKIGGKPLALVALEEIRPEPGSGYVQTSWSGKDIQQEMATLEANNPNRSGIAFGGLYWQYFEPFEQTKSSETNVQISKRLFLRQTTERGDELKAINEQTTLKVGDLVTVRMELRADSDYEYVHLKDMRASGFEPVSAFSGHRYQDGLWYYESIKDASTNFFITRLPKGTYVFEYDLRVTHAGEFSNGITTFQCMYAPECSAHSEGLHVKITE